MFLAIETATNVCSVVLRDQKGHMHEKRTESRGAHSEKLFLFIEELKNEYRFEIKDLSAVLISEGPGSYTGLRIGASAVKGLLFQHQVPLYAANTLASFAFASFTEDPALEKVHSIIDARRVHVYHQQFSGGTGKFESDTSVRVIPIEEFLTLVEAGDGIIGTGLKRLGTEIVEQASAFGTEYLTARSLVRMFEHDTGRLFFHEADPEAFDPKYYSSNQVK